MPERDEKFTPGCDGSGASPRVGRLLAGVVAAALLATAFSCSGGSMVGDDTGIEPLVGDWRGVLLSDGGELPFKLRVNAEGSDLPAVVLNGGFETPIAAVSRQGAASYTFVFPGDDSEIVAKMSPNGEELWGYWRYAYDEDSPIAESGGKSVTQMPFSATKNDERRFQRNDPTLEVASPEGSAALPDLNGEWQTTLHGVFEAVSEMTQDAERVTGTLGGPEPPMEGIYRHGLLRMSVFDGRRAVLLHARAQPDGTLQGTLWHADLTMEEWAARRFVTGSR